MFMREGGLGVRGSMRKRRILFSDWGQCVGKMQACFWKLHPKWDGRAGVRPVGGERDAQPSYDKIGYGFWW